MACFQDEGSSDESLCMESDAGGVELDVMERSDSASGNSDAESSNVSLLAEDSKESLVAESMCEAMELEVPLLQDGGDHELTSEFSPCVPGINTGLWLGRKAPIGEQAQVLITNVVQCLRGLPGKALREMKIFCSVQAGKARSSFVTQIGSRLLGLSVGTVETVWARVRANAWQPQKPTESLRRTQVTAGGLSPTQAPQEQEPALSHQDARRRCLCNMVRLALSTGLEGGSQNQYIRQLQRMALAGADVDTT